MGRIRNLVLGLLVALVLAGCGAAKAYKQGLAFEVQGKVVAASGRYLDALDKKASHEEARAALAALAEEAWERRANAARDLEEHGDFEAAGTRYASLGRYQDRLEAHGLLDFHPRFDPMVKVEEMKEATAAREYALAEKAFGAGKWELAIRHYGAALAVRPDYRDAAERIGAVHLAWGEEVLTEGQYRGAAERFEEAWRNNAPEGRARAAEVYAALGRHHLGHGACRQAWRDLTASVRLGGPVQDEVATAMDCAEVRVAVTQVSGPRRRTLGEVNVVARIHAAVLERLPEAVTSFVVLVDESVLGRTTDRTPAAHWVIDETVHSATLSSDAPEPQERYARAYYDAECTNEETGATEPCRNEFDVRYKEVEASKEVALSLSAKAVRFDARGNVYARTFDIVATDEVHYAEDLRHAETGRPIDLSGTGATEVHVDDSLRALAEARRDLVSDRDLVIRAIEELATEVVDWVAPRLDVEPVWTDPTSLEDVPFE
jgi:tetratricopeptide (TPR) repeat protein